MKKKFLIFSLLMAGAFSGAVVWQDAQAKESGSYLLQTCSSYDSNGNTVAVGNTCITGTANCVSNPCP